MSSARYSRYEKYIAAADSGSIRQRWEYGRLMLTDDAKTTPAGNLRNGAIADLIIAAQRIGRKLSEREIQHRLQCGKAYPAEAQIAHICTSYETWGALRKAGFPAVEAPPGAEPYDPRGGAERARDAARNLARHGAAGDGQLALFDYFPGDKFDELSTLGELAKYAAEMAELTERYARKDRERAGYLARLITAVNGDMSATWEEAQAALDGEAA
jgi:hypothetical protein